eukprot:82915_1
MSVMCIGYQISFPIHVHWISNQFPNPCSLLCCALCNLDLLFLFFCLHVSLRDLYYCDSSSSLSSDSAAQTLSFENSPKYQEFVSKIDNLYETQRQMRRKINTQAQLIRTQEKRLAVYQAQSLKWNEFMDKCGILEDKKEANV